MSCPDFTRVPRSTPIESTYAVTFGKTATNSYACSSPGKRVVMDSFFDATFTISTVGVAAAEACAFVLELVFEPHDTHPQLVATSTQVDTIRNRFMPFLQSRSLPFVRTRSPGRPDPAKETALPRAAEPVKTPR